MTRKQFEAEVAKRECTADIAEIKRLGVLDITVDAPEGRVFHGSGTHTLVHATADADIPGTKSRIYLETLADIDGNLPFAKCNDPGCCYCDPEEHR